MQYFWRGSSGNLKLITLGSEKPVVWREADCASPVCSAGSAEQAAGAAVHVSDRRFHRQVAQHRGTGRDRGGVSSLFVWLLTGVGSGPPVPCLFSCLLMPLCYRSFSVFAVFQLGLTMFSNFFPGRTSRHSDFIWLPCQWTSGGHVSTYLYFYPGMNFFFQVRRVVLLENWSRKTSTF